MTSLLLLKSLIFANALQKSKKKKKVKMRKSVNQIPNKLDMTMCRICNDKKGIISIFNNILQPEIPKEIKSFTGVTVNQSDDLPDQMCQSCLDLLKGCVLFRDMCQRTNDVMTKLLLQKKESESKIKIKLSEESKIKIHVKHNSETEDINGIEFDNDLNDEQDDLKHDNKIDAKAESDSEMYNVSSPAFSDSSEIWGCNLCSKEFSNLKSYSKHLSKCKKDFGDTKPPEEQAKSAKVFLCDICGKVSRSYATLLVHMNIHYNIFPFKCQHCPYQGRSLDLLKVHQRIHSEDKPYKCTHCPKATRTSSNLAKHMRHVHSTNRPFKCSYCDKGFTYLYQMKRHIRDIHLRTSTVECDVCLKRFNTKKILQGHRMKIHKIRCERQGRMPSYLQYQTEENDGPNCDFSEYKNG